MIKNNLKFGDKVQISDQSLFKDQGRSDGKKLIGVVRKSGYHQFQYEVDWSNGSSYLYNDEDLVSFSSSEPDYEIY